MAYRIKALINGGYYETKEKVVEILNTFYMWQQLTLDEYNELMQEAEECYPEPVVEDTPTILPLEPEEEPEVVPYED